MTDFTLHLLRHGAPELPGRLMGHTDCEPTDTGTHACVARMSGIAIDRIITSDLRRTHSAGAAIGAEHGIAPTIDPRWRELNFGAWDGKHASEVDPDQLGRFWQEPDISPPPGGERWSSLVARVASAFTELEPVPTLVVTHAGTIRAALNLLCRFDQRQLWAFDLPYAALVSLRVWRGQQPGAQIIGLQT